MSQTVRYAFDKRLDNYDQIKSVAQTNLNKRKCSIQECVNHILPECHYEKLTLG